MFDKLLIANRGEIAVRIARTCRELGVRTVAVFSDVDAGARHVALCDEAVPLPGVAPADTYLNGPAIIAAAVETSSEAVHPGYGFLAESADFADAVVDAGLSWVGPPPDAMRLVADKLAARATARAAGVPLVPGTPEPVRHPGEVAAFATVHGYPVAIKAAGGGGGRGLKLAHGPEDVTTAFESARREAEAYFGTAGVYVERYLEAPKHMEVQLLASAPDAVVWLGVRDCSLQRRYQKLVEETPPPRWADQCPAMGTAAARLAAACGYLGAGTAEFLVDENGAFFFLEVNARLQVEHTITEEVTGLDLVACQLRIAAGEPLGLTQGDVAARGHAIECRINAEDPGRDFAPAPGTITRYVEPGGLGVRVDSGYAEGDHVPAAYDSLIAKLITSGRDRAEALARMRRCLDDFVIEGVATTIPAHRALVREPSFVDGTHTTATVAGGVLEGLAAGGRRPEDRRGVLVVEGVGVRLWHPSMAEWATAAVAAADGGELVSPMQGTVLEVLVEEGDPVAAGDAIVTVEAMKMETTVTAPREGKVTSLLLAPGDAVAAGQVVAVIE